MAPGGLIFASALILMLAIGLIEAFGLGVSGFDLDFDLNSDLLGWLGVGRVPFLMLLVAFLMAFGIIGLAGQQVATAIAGSPLSAFIAVPGAFLAAIPATGVLGRGLARIMPHDESTAYDLDALVGHFGTISVGRASAGSPARTRVIDPFGQPHHVLVEPDNEQMIFEEGDTVLLVRREGLGFRAILHSQPRYTDWIER